MKTNRGRALAALSLALLWLFASPARVAALDCQLVFEAIPSEDAGPIIGQLVKHNLAGKSYKQWGQFTATQAQMIIVFLEENFGKVVKIEKAQPAMGGFQGKSSPNAIVDISVTGSPEGNTLGEAMTPVTAAVGFILIQDGTVTNCNKSVGEKFGSSIATYSVIPVSGFNKLDERFVTTVYSAMVIANDNLEIGYTFVDGKMLMLDFGKLLDQLKVTVEYFKQLYSEPVSIKFPKIADQPTIYVANNWAIDREGLELLAKLPQELYGALYAARNDYLQALMKFAAATD